VQPLPELCQRKNSDECPGSEREEQVDINSNPPQNENSSDHGLEKHHRDKEETMRHLQR
jgi:hypothetical protein